MYRDRTDAGLQLAEAVVARLPGHGEAGCSDELVLGLPRGGVPVAAEVARALGAPLDAVIARKLGVPGSPEVAMGAIASVGGKLAVVANEELRARIDAVEGPGAWADVLALEEQELHRRESAYRDGRPPLDVAGRTVVLVDDGIATGATMRAAAHAVRELGPARLLAAVPVALSGAREALQASVDELICPWFASTFMGVGQAYSDFTQTEDDEVRRLLAAN